MRSNRSAETQQARLPEARPCPPGLHCCRALFQSSRSRGCSSAQGILPPLSGFALSESVRGVSRPSGSQFLPLLRENCQTTRWGAYGILSAGYKPGDVTRGQGTEGGAGSQQKPAPTGGAPPPPAPKFIHAFKHTEPAALPKSKKIYTPAHLMSSLMKN